MYSRPTPRETDEDLIRLQEEFARQRAENKIQLAATVVHEKKDEKPQCSTETTSTEIQDQLANTFEAIPEHNNLGNIVEKNPQNFQSSRLNFSTNRGFPVPKRRDAHGETSSRCSIFAQQFKRVKKEPLVTPPETCLPSQSFVVTGSEKDEIHLENINKMKSMSEAEILEEKERLMATMDPAIIAFLKSRRRKEAKLDTNRTPTIKEQNEAAENMEVDDIQTTDEILKDPQAEKWLNFSTLETTKLAWMKDVERPKIDKNKSFEARFDFEGWLLPYAEDEITEKSRILYHHGEEPGRPGYTLQELFQLSRSNVIQQKIVALNSIANILALHSTGVYDDIIDLPIEQIFFVLRFCLDDNTPAVLTASIKAMRNLFYSKIDETCLDCLLGFGLGQVQPTLAIDDDPEDDDRVNDQQLAETNLVKCLARTEILVRIRYIINPVRPTIETVVHCLDILTRLARDSQFIFTKVFKCENLISSIVSNFVPNTIIRPSDPNSPYGLPLIQALKLLRILACRSQTIATNLVERHRIMDSVVVYLSNNEYSTNTNGLKLQTESMHLWSAFLHYGLATDHFLILQPVLLELLSYHFKNTNLDMETTYVRQGHVSALLVLIGSCKVNFIQPYIEILQSCVIKWFNQFMILTEFACGKLQIIAAMFSCLASVNKVAEVLDIDELILKLLTSEGFKTVTRTIINGSMLLNNYETHKSSANLKTLECAAWFTSEHVVPLVQSNSPLPFLSALSKFVEVSRNKDVKLAFLHNENIANYLKELLKLDKYYLTSHWLTRIESSLIMNILKVSVEVRPDLDTRTFYELAVKSLSIFTADQKPDIELVLRNIILSRQFYPSEVLIGNLSIEQRHECLATSLDNLGEILEVYVRVLGLKTDVPTFMTNLSLDVSKGNVIPIDWIYTPIVVLYFNQQQNKQNLTEQEQVFIVRNCLRWILIYETYFPELTKAVNPTDRFCRVACVFMGSDNLFLVDEIHSLLKLCLHNIMKCEKEINFNKEIEGLNSFQDFYTQLLEQYQGVSYGDVLFGNFILVPLGQRHSIKWRKTLWSEYLGVVEIFNVTEDQSVCPVELFLEPREEDLSLLKCYRRAIVSNSVRKHSILYKVAKHHVEQFVANRNKQ